MNLINEAMSIAFSTNTAKLYIDPATTSFLLQALIGAGIGIAAVAGIIWSKMRRAFKKNKGEEKAAPKETEETNEEKIISADDLLDDEE